MEWKTVYKSISITQCIIAYCQWLHTHLLAEVVMGVCLWGWCFVAPSIANDCTVSTGRPAEEGTETRVES